MIKVDKEKFIKALKKKLADKKAAQEVINAVLYPSQEDVLEELSILKQNLK